MKRILLLLICFSLFSCFCDSNRRTCWSCTTKIAFAFLDEEKEPPLISTYSFEKCNLSKKEIKAFEKSLTNIQIFRESVTRKQICLIFGNQRCIKNGK